MQKKLVFSKKACLLITSNLAGFLQSATHITRRSASDLKILNFDLKNLWSSETGSGLFTAVAKPIGATLSGKRLTRSTDYQIRASVRIFFSRLPNLN
jgi:hypothetical protein